jgi:hypothetical protein
MFCRFLATIVAVMLCVGGLFAEEIKGVFKKFEDGKLTIAVDDAEKTYKVSPDAKFKRKTADGSEKEFDLTKALSSPFLKDGTPMVVIVEKERVIDFRVDLKKKKE